MKQQAVIDSSVLVALIDENDKWHSQANGLLAGIRENRFDLVYFDCVLNETISVMARRSEEQKRSAQFPALLNELMEQVPEDQVTWLSRKIEHWYRDIIGLVQQSAGKLNFHDALIALGCKEIGANVIISFDRDFDDVQWLQRYI
jgi:predicted nucleic acid-binding protein